MANTTFFKKAEEDADKITWKDVFSESLKHHSREDLEYALLAGTAMDGTTEQNMLQKWRKPWLYLRFLGIGGIAVLVMLVLLYVQSNMLLIRLPGYEQTTVIVISLLVPITLMIFFWETNIPRNIAWYELVLYFVLGAVLAFFVTAVLFFLIPESVDRYGIEFEMNSFAAFREEPAKLAASVLILSLCFRKKKLYGLMGLVVGAAVGAGFGGFESINYGLTGLENGMGSGMHTALFRAFTAVGGHALFCAPYTAAIALHSPEGKLEPGSFFNRDFAVTFLASVAGHFLWNSGIDEYLFFLSYIDIEKFSQIMASQQAMEELNLLLYRGELFVMIFVTVLLWCSCIYILRKSLNQIVRAGRTQSAAASVRLQFVSGPLKGKSFECSGASAVHIGRDLACELVIPDTGGVSRRHCRLQCENGKWFLQDLNSSYGTIVNGNRINTSIQYPLNMGDRVSLGGNEVSFIIAKR